MRKGKASNRMDKLFSKGTNITQQAVRAGMMEDFDAVAPGMGATKLDRMNEKALRELRRRSSITRRDLREKGALQGNNMEAAEQTLGIQRKVLEGSSETRALALEGRKELKRERKQDQQREKTEALAGSIEAEENRRAKADLPPMSPADINALVRSVAPPPAAKRGRKGEGDGPRDGKLTNPDEAKVSIGWKTISREERAERRTRG